MKNIVKHNDFKKAGAARRQLIGSLAERRQQIARKYVAKSLSTKS